MKIGNILIAAASAVIVATVATSAAYIYNNYKDFRKEVDGVKTKHAKRLEELEAEYASLKDRPDSNDRCIEIMKEICAIHAEITKVVHEAGDTMSQRNSYV